MKNFILILGLLFPFVNFSQTVLKENLTPLDKIYWDIKKTKIQSAGSYYKDALGQTRDKHGKWEYYNEFGDLEETRNFYREKLHGQVFLKYANGKPRQEGYFKLNKQDSIYREWVENGNLIVEGYYKNNKPFGIWKRYYMNGQPESIEEYIDTVCYIKSFWLNDSLHTQVIKNGNGTKTAYFPNGKLKEKYNYKDGLRDGPCEDWSINGYILLKGNFKQERKDGEWNYYYYTGDLEKTSNYKNGLLEGPYTYYYDTKMVNVSGNYHLGKKEGKWNWFTNKGGKDMEGSFVNDLQDGAWIYYYPTGQVSYNAFYKEGKKEGKWEYYYKNNHLFKVGTFKNDVKDGLWETWYEDGTLLMTGKYSNGKEQGVWKNFWENGKLKNQSTFKNGELHGKWLSWSPQGNTLLTGFYKNNLKTGTWTRYMENGKIEEIESYKIISRNPTNMNYGFWKNKKVKESIRHGKYESYSQKDFQLTEKGQYKNDLKEGTWIAYLPGGKLPAFISNYKNGALDGLMIEFGRSGEKISETSYSKGLKNGKLKVFDKKGKVILEKEFINGIEKR
jgi:antitoxin component YwqK of YwqJK toxin-antitoxin module